MEGREDRELTIAFAYYDQPSMLEKQFEVLTSYADEVKERIRIVIADDASPEFPIASCEASIEVEIYRILDDVPWSQMCARNLAMHHIKGWALLVDLDHTVPEALARYLLDFLPRARKDHYYLIPRAYARAREKMRIAPNLYMVHHEAYWKAGGMDESFRGRKGWSDFTFRSAMEATGIQSHILKDAPKMLAWSWKDWHHRMPALISDADVTKLDRDIRKNGRKREMIIEKCKFEGWGRYIRGLRPLQFRWKRIYP